MLKSWRTHIRLATENLHIKEGANGGDDWIRTSDPLRAKQVLSQLSYTPYHFSDFGRAKTPSYFGSLGESSGLLSSRQLFNNRF